MATTTTQPSSEHNNDNIDDEVMPVWLSDNEIDPRWIRSNIPDSEFGNDDDEAVVSHAHVVDISNDTRKGARPRDGATLLLTLTFTSSSTTSSTPTKTKTLVIKQVPDSGLDLSQRLGLAREAFFFNDLAPKIKIDPQNNTSSSSPSSVRIPKVYYAYGNMTEGTKIVIMEDLSDGYIDSGILFGPGNPNNWNRNLPEKIAAAYGANDGSSKPSPPSSFEVANQTFLSIAQVHATFWNDSSLLDSSKTTYLRGATWVNGENEESWKASQGLIQGMWAKLNSNNKNEDGDGGSVDIDQRIRWDPLVKRTVQKAMDGISWEAQTQRLNTNTNWTLVHGDFWPGNVMVSTTDLQDLRLLDWEMTGLGSGPQDLGQYVLSNMDPQERRDCEQQLIRNYYNELLALGVTKDFSWEECFKEYQIGGVERWLWFLVYFVANDNLLSWAQFFHDQIMEFMHDHNINPEDITQPRP